MDNHLPSKALDLIDKIEPPVSDVMLTIIFTVCAAASSDEKAIQLGNRFYRETTAIETKNLNTINAILNMLMKFGQLKEAEQLFQSLKNKDQITMGAMIKGFIEQSLKLKFEILCWFSLHLRLCG